MIDNILETLFKWEMSRYDYPFCVAMHPRTLDILKAEVPHMLEVDFEKQQHKFRGIPVAVVHDSDRDYFEFMDEAMVKIKAGHMDDGTWEQKKPRHGTFLNQVWGR